jgi:hypothetical protein
VALYQGISAAGLKGHLRANKNIKTELKVLERKDKERGCCEGQSEECIQQKGGYTKLTARTAGPKKGSKKVSSS